MSKKLKILVTVLVTITMFCTCAQAVLAAGIDTTTVIEGINGNITGDTAAASDLMKLAGKIIALVQVASAVAAVVLVAVFGFKFIMGSANEKADYQKSFIPLIVGVVVVFSATSIARLLFGLIGSDK